MFWPKSAGDGWGIFSQPGEPSAVLLVAAGVTIVLVALTTALCATDPSGLGNRATPLQRLFGAWTRVGRVRNWLCSPCDRARGKYPCANTCQIPWFSSLGEIYSFVFGGVKADGLFVEIGAFDGESFSNTSGLADLGWRGHYVEPIPAYAHACATRHAANAKVTVHNVCVGERDGETVELSAAGPFSSAVEDEMASVSNSKMAAVLSALGWGHQGGAGAAAPEKVRSTTVSLNTFFQKNAATPGAVDVLVIDTEGFEAPILRGFDLARWRPKLVIVEIQEKQARYRDNARVQRDAVAIEEQFRLANYSILYRDPINTVFIDKDVACAGGD